MSTPQQALAILIAAPAGVIAAANLAASAGCGIGSSLSQVSNIVRTATTTINNTINEAVDLITAVQVLPNLIATQVSTAVSSTLTNLLGPIRPTANSLQQEVQVLLLLINDPVRFAAHYNEIASRYGSTAVIQAINSITQGTSFCQAIGQQPGGPHSPSTQAATGSGPGQTVPITTAPPSQSNNSATSQNNAPS